MPVPEHLTLPKVGVWNHPKELMWELNEFMKYLEQGLVHNKH